MGRYVKVHVRDGGFVGAREGMDGILEVLDSPRGLEDCGQWAVYRVEGELVSQHTVQVESCGESDATCEEQ